MERGEGMSKSKAKKHREKMTREGKRSPELNRGIYACTDLSTKRTKTKKEALLKQEKKTHRFYKSDEFFYDGFKSRCTISSLPVSGSITSPWTRTSGGSKG